MNYPIWLLERLGGGTLIAMIAVLHVYISHLAVGGGLFIWLMDRRARMANDTALNNFLRRYNWIFLLVTMVLGGLTGVGIWFVIGLVSPAATSTLIHTFVFGWAIEWVFFIGEITALLVYHYYFDKLERALREKAAFFYFLFAFLSLVIINGILSFMLTPGKWLATGDFWDGFFNPSYVSSTLFRTFVTVMVAGIFGFLVGSFQKDEGLSLRMVRTCSRWIIAGIAGLVPTGFWYYYSLPAATREVAFQLNPQIIPTFTLMLVMTAIVAVIGLIFILKLPRIAQRIFAIVLVLAGASWMAGFEYTREIARKPFVIHDYMYSSGILVRDVDRLNSEGVLPNAKWTSVHEVTADNVMEAGRELMRLECLACHTLGGRNDLLSRTENMTYMGMMASLSGQGRVMGYMPPFIGTFAEKDALARYIVAGLHGKEIVTQPGSHTPGAGAGADPKSVGKSSNHVLLAWNDLGMHCISDSDPWFVILPPANTLEAQLIKRGNPPQIVTTGVRLTFEAPAGFGNPVDHVPFWDYAKINFGADLAPNIGLGGLGLDGDFALKNDGISFIAQMIPVTPYPDGGGYNPYPQFTVKAFDKATGALIAETRAVTPTSTEMGCRNCHGGPWRTEDQAGVSGKTAKNILASHDRLSGTDLLKQANAGKPMICQTCHPDPAIGAKGLPGHNSLSAAMHGWHASYMVEKGGDACVLCHPAYSSGFTRCLRGVHVRFGMDCTSCHGTLDEHAAGLLKREMENGTVSAGRLSRPLHLTRVASLEEVNPRTPWLQEPDCITCHADYDKPVEGASSYNMWTKDGSELYRNRAGEAGAVRCIACHGSTHANYPARNEYVANLDNFGPLQYQGLPYSIGANFKCTVCHTVLLDYAIHHDNLPRMVRNPVK
ncbi:MAG: cytochrome C [bacterium]